MRLFLALAVIWSLLAHVILVPTFFAAGLSLKTWWRGGGGGGVGIIVFLGGKKQIWYLSECSLSNRFHSKNFCGIHRYGYWGPKESLSINVLLYNWYLLGMKKISSHTQKTGFWHLLWFFFPNFHSHPRGGSGKGTPSTVWPLEFHHLTYRHCDQLH